MNVYESLKHYVQLRDNVIKLLEKVTPAKQWQSWDN